MLYSFELDISPDELAHIEEAYRRAYDKDVREVIEIMLRQSAILGACPFYPELTDPTPKYAQWEADIPDVDWRDAEAVERWMEQDDD